MGVHVGADLEIWGPEFTGKATIDLDIISFTIHFGAANKDTRTHISWNQFVTEMLPGQTPSSFGAPPVQGMLATEAASQDTSGIHVNVSKGLVKTLSSDPGTLNFVVNPETFEMTITPTIPVKSRQVSFDGLVKLAPNEAQPHDAHGQLIAPNDAFGVGPVGVSHEDFMPSLSIAITLKSEGLEAVDDGPLITLQGVRILSNAPNSLWQNLTFDEHGSPQLNDPLNDTAIANVITGYRIVPVPLTPDHTLPINIEYLKYTTSPNIQHYAWSTAYIPTTDPFTDQRVEDTIMSATAQANRAALLPVLNAYLPDISTTVDVGSMTNSTHAGLLAQPVLRLLGEHKLAA